MADTTIQTGTKLQLNFDVENRGTRRGSQTVELLLDDEVVDEAAAVLDSTETGHLVLETDAFSDDDDGQVFVVETVIGTRTEATFEVEVTTIPDSGGTHQWNITEGSGTVVEDVIGNLDADFTGLTWQSGAGAGETHITLNGTDEYGDLGDGAFTHFISDVQGTLGGWYRMDATGDIYSLFSVDTSSSENEFSMRIRSDNNDYNAYLRVDNDDTGFITGGTPNDHDGNWIFFAITSDGSTFSLYVAEPSGYDVTEIGNASAPSSGSGNWSSNVSWGRETGGDRHHWDGGVDINFADSTGWTESELQEFVDDTKEFYEA